MELEHGIVKFFDGRQGKEYGFLTVLNRVSKETPEEIFFHFNDGEFVEIVEDGDDIEFVGRVFPGNGMHMWHPRVGDSLAFLRAPGRDGREKASPWTYDEAYDKRVRALFEPHYRVVKVKRYADSTPEESRVIWENRGAGAMSRDFDVRIIDGELWDPLAESIDWVEGSTAHYSFERWDIAAGIYAPSNPNGGQLGSWVKCSDPRKFSELVQRQLMGERI